MRLPSCRMLRIKLNDFANEDLNNIAGNFQFSLEFNKFIYFSHRKSINGEPWELNFSLNLKIFKLNLNLKSDKLALLNGFFFAKFRTFFVKMNLRKEAKRCNIFTKNKFFFAKQIDLKEIRWNAKFSAKKAKIFDV